MKRRSSQFNTQRIDHLYQDPHEPDPRLVLHHGDLTDATNLIRIVQQVRPEEIYNLAAQSHVQVSFETPEYTANADALGWATSGRLESGAEADLLVLRPPETWRDEHLVGRLIYAWSPRLIESRIAAGRSVSVDTIHGPQEPTP